MTHKKMTWADLSRFVSELTDVQMNMPVTVWGDEKPVMFIHSAETLPEDFVQTDEGLEERSVIENNLQEDETMEDYPVFAVKGQAFLNEWIPDFHAQPEGNK